MFLTGVKKSLTKFSRCFSSQLKPATRLEVDYNSGGTSVWVFARQHLEKYNCINHGQGFPDWQCPDFVKQAAIDSIMGDFNQYSPPTGHPLLLKELSIEYSNKLNREINYNNIQPTVGCCGGIENCCQAFLNFDDEVITFEPYFDFYKFQVGHTGAKLNTVPLIYNNENKKWTFDIELLESKFNNKTKLFLLNSPHNPTGMVFNKSQLQSIVDILDKYPNVIVVSDEVYEDIIFDNNNHYHIANLKSKFGNDMFNRTITVNSAAKKFSVTGWKIGFCIGPKELIEAVHYVTRGQNWCVATCLQVAVSKMLNSARNSYYGFNNYYEWLSEMYNNKRNLILELMDNCGLTFDPPQGTFFAVGDATNIANKLISNGEIDFNSKYNIDWQMTSYIAKNASVTCIPMSAFTTSDYIKYDNKHYLRFSFCVKDDSFKQSIKQIKNIKTSLNL